MIVLSDHEVNSVPLHRCDAPALKSCDDCVAFQVGDAIDSSAIDYSDKDCSAIESIGIDSSAIDLDLAIRSSFNFLLM